MFVNLRLLSLDKLQLTALLLSRNIDNPQFHEVACHAKGSVEQVIGRIDIFMLLWSVTRI
jgi:hypothetical protein